MVKYSSKREAIYNYLMSTKEHPTAEMIYRDVRKDFPNISLGTVYRNLLFLEEQGKINRLSFGENSERYDGNIGPHYHFICKKCGKVIDLNMMPLDHINVIAGEKFDGEIETHNVCFRGVCAECLNTDH